jgi:hypothetical protein
MGLGKPVIAALCVEDNGKTIVTPEAGISTGVIVNVGEVKVEVLAVRFPGCVVFFQGKGGGSIHVALESDEIAQTIISPCKQTIPYVEIVISSMIYIPLL